MMTCLKTPTASGIKEKLLGTMIWLKMNEKYENDNSIENGYFNSLENDNSIKNVY